MRFICTYILLISLLISTVAFTDSQPVSMENITVEDWVDPWRQSWAYEALDRLSSRGFISGFFHAKPIPARELEIYISEALESIEGGMKPDAQDSYYLARLIDHYMPDWYEVPDSIKEHRRSGRPSNMAFREESNEFLYFRSGAQFLPIGDKWKTDVSRKNASIETMLEGSIDITSRATIAGRWKIRQYFGDRWMPRYTSSDYVLRKRVWRTVAPAEKGYINMELNIFHVLVGRDELSWGPGYRSNMLFSSSAPTYDVFKANALWKGVRMEFFTALLNPTTSTYVSGHRLDLGFWKWLDISVAEVVYYTGKGPCLYYINPLLPYYFVQWAEGDPDNILLELGGEVRIIPNTRIYTALMIDDYYKEQWKKLLKSPHKVGMILGVQYANPLGLSSSNLRVEYSRVNPGTYMHFSSEHYYLYRGIVPGYYQESDSDNIFLEFSKMLYPGILAFSGFNYERKGEFSAYVDDLPEAWNDYAKGMKFPSGDIVQRGYTLSFGFNAEPLFWRFDTAFRFDLLRYSNVKNQEGNDIEGCRASLLFRFTL
ncbi:MAG: hypothetical protein DRH49_02490 [Candidatus Coatesbacteria bacterium]|nr:MAG: hypothetical protein DRH49_02490 [Candidatus Coatesbacteria bacterium]